VIDGARTRDIQDHNLTLYQLSYDHHVVTALFNCIVKHANFSNTNPTNRARFSEMPVEPPIKPNKSAAEKSSSDDVVRINATLSLPNTELTWRFSASGGPGGQHANTSNTKASVSFDIENSPALTEFQRAKLLEKIGPELTCIASDERSQLRNRNLALERLRARLSEALVVLPPRKATRPSKGAQQRRLDSKTRNATVKTGRRTRYSRDSD
jgi:ribosome-associated protein